MASATPSQSPTRPHVPNAHPYSIKTTSTGILTRSNSSSAHGSWARHQYSPAPPSPNLDVRNSSPSRSETRMSVSPSPSKYTRSWVGKTPAGERVKLPRHPYLWTPEHLSTYLSTALNGGHGEPLEPDVVQHIVEFVQEQKIGGRAFLGLDQEDFQEMDGVDPTWSDAFWDAACTLRATATPYRPSRVSSGVYKRGRVRGIVGVFERSASESSDVGEDDLLRPIRLHRTSISGSGYESTGDEALPADTSNHVRSPRRSGAPTPRPSHAPASPDPNADLTPHTREVEIVSFTDDTELTMAELYEKTYGVPAPAPNHRASDGNEDGSLGETVKITAPEGEPYEKTYASPAPPPRHRASDDDETSIGETVKITAPEDNTEISTSSEKVEVIALSPPAPPSLADLFVPTAPVPLPKPAPEAHFLMPSPVIAAPAPQSVYVLPLGNDTVAVRTLDALKTRLELVEGRIAAMERKDLVNGDIAHPAEDDAIDDSFARWSETRQSAYVLLAGITAGASVVLVPLLFRHLWTR